MPFPAKRKRIVSKTLGLTPRFLLLFRLISFTIAIVVTNVTLVLKALSMAQNFSNENSEYTLQVSEFAALCNTTRDTLRYYYEQNILVPWKNPKNGYHYYSSAQIGSFFFITTLRQTGCSIAEIGKIIHNLSRDGIEELANTKIREMQHEAFLITKKISALQLGMWILGKYNSHKPGTPFVDVMPPMSVFSSPISDKDSSFHAGDIAADIAAHITKTSRDDSLPMFPAGVTIDYDDLVAGKYAYNKLISLSFLPADNIGTFPLPGSKAVLCYQDNNAPDIEKTYRKMLSLINKNKFKAVSDLYSISLINLYDDARNHTYFKYLFICVE